MSAILSNYTALIHIMTDDVTLVKTITFLFTSVSETINVCFSSFHFPSLP